MNKTVYNTNTCYFEYMYNKIICKENEPSWVNIECVDPICIRVCMCTYTHRCHSKYN